MTPEHEAIAKRLRVQCERHGWMTGMRTLESPPRAPCITIPEWDEAIVVVADDGDEPRVLPLVTHRERPIHDGALPDPHDPATIGCFAAMTRRVLDDPLLCATLNRLHYATPPSDTGWHIRAFALRNRCWTHEAIAHGATEIEAWLAALEATP